jgi:hypothetical protein
MLVILCTILLFRHVRQCEVTYRKYALKQGNRIGVRLIKYDIQGVVELMLNFSYRLY